MRLDLWLKLDKCRAEFPDGGQTKSNRVKFDFKQAESQIFFYCEDPMSIRPYRTVYNV